MAFDLTYARGSVKEVADGLGLAPGRLSKWRQEDSWPVRSMEGLSEEQKGCLPPCAGVVVDVGVDAHS